MEHDEEIDMEFQHMEDDSRMIPNFTRYTFNKTWAIPREEVWQDKLFLRNNLVAGLELELPYTSKQSCPFLIDELQPCNPLRRKYRDCDEKNREIVPIGEPRQEDYGNEEEFLNDRDLYREALRSFGGPDNLVRSATWNPHTRYGIIDSRNFDNIGTGDCPYGVVDIYKDGSIIGPNYAENYPLNVHNRIDASYKNGLEIVFVGTSEPFKIIYDRLKHIESVVKRVTPRGRELTHKSAGEHITLMAIPQTSLPLVYICNMYQYVRKNLAPLLWLCSCNKPWSYFLRESTGHRMRNVHHAFIFRGSQNGWNYDGRDYAGVTTILSKPIEAFRTLREFINSFYCAQHANCPHRYYALNISPLAFHPGSNPPPHVEVDEYERMSLKGFICELRIPDRIPVPSAETALMFLTKAMMMMCVDYSEFGLIKINPADEDWKKNERISIDMTNGKPLPPEDIDWLITQSHRIVRELSPYFYYMGSPEVRTVLHKMAQTPITYLINEPDVMTYEQVDRFLFDKNPVFSDRESIDDELYMLLSTQAFNGYDNETDWRNDVAKDLGVTTMALSKALSRVSYNIGPIGWDYSVGALTFSGLKRKFRGSLDRAKKEYPWYFPNNTSNEEVVETVEGEENGQ